MRHDDDLDFMVETEDLDGRREVLARASKLPIARAAYDAACAMRQGGEITLRMRARVIARRGPEEAERGSSPRTS